MRKSVFLGTLIVAAFAVSVAAQTPADQQSPSKQNQQQVTVTGCLTSADPAGATAGTSGQATGGSKSEGQFLLTNARITSGAAGTSGTAGSGGTGTAGATTSSANKFVLIGGNQQELKQYVNSDVEIRGTLQPRSGADPGSAASATGSAQRSPQSDPNANVQRLRVTSVKQTAKTCAGGN